MDRSRRGRLAGAGVALLATALLAGACAGNGSGDAAAPPPTGEPTASPTTVVALKPTTTAPAAERSPAGGSGARRAPTATTTPRRAPATTVPPASRPRGAFPGLFPAGDWDGLGRLERAVAGGHQPWLLDPRMVAGAYLSDTERDGAQVGGWAPSGAAAGTVSYTYAGVAGSVRLVKPAGSSLWVVISSDTARLSVGGVTRSGGTIRVDVTSPAKGTVTALAGPYASEWLSQDSSAIGPAVNIRLTLGDGGPAHPRVLRLRHTSTDGVVTVAERRVESSQTA